MSWLNVKVILVVFDWKHLVHYEFVPCGHTINKEEVLWHLGMLYAESDLSSRKIRVGYCTVTTHLPMPHFLSGIIWKNTETTVLPHLPYSLDLLAPAYYFLISKLKVTLKGHHFQILNMIDTDNSCASSPKMLPGNVQKIENLEWYIASSSDYFLRGQASVKL